MSYNPWIYQPYQYGQSAPVSQPSWPYPQPQQPQQQPVNGLVGVTGIEGAKAYQLPPNSTMPLFDQDEDVLYLKTTDAAGYPTIKAMAGASPEERERMKTELRGLAG